MLAKIAHALSRPIEWDCERCNVRDVTPPDVTNRYHFCSGLSGLTAPLRRPGERVLIQMREDYVGTEDVQYDGEGRPVASLSTERVDGSNDLHVYAPTAYLDGKAPQP